MSNFLNWVLAALVLATICTAVAWIPYLLWID